MTAVKLPAGHGAQAGAPAGAYWPAAHDAHALLEASPVVARKVPAGQLGQIGAPDTAAYWPAGHGVQAGAPAGAYWPAVHGAHALLEISPVVARKVPAEHWLQLVDDDALVVAEYCPAAHDVQATLPVPAAYWPAKHPAQLDAVDGANCPDGHG